MIDTRNGLSRLSSAIDDARSALNTGDESRLRERLYHARALLHEMLTGPSRPDFIVKATDPEAPAVVLFWIDRAYQGEVPVEKRKKAMEHYDRLVAWQKENPDQVKKPD